MRMTKADLKKTLKPIIEECVRETLYESGLLSSIISEVVQGVMSGQQVLQERVQPAKTAQRKSAAPKTDSSKELATEQKRVQIKQQKKNLIDSIGQSANNGVDLFEGTTPLKSGGSPSAGPSSQGPFSGVDPSDPGVNIDSLTDQLGGVWKKLAEGRKK